VEGSVLSGLAAALFRPRPNWRRVVDAVVSSFTSRLPPSVLANRRDPNLEWSLPMGSRTLTIFKIILIVAVMAMLVNHSKLVGALQFP
jgi:hypothetical protein